jgi:hypothetical protein
MTDIDLTQVNRYEVPAGGQDLLSGARCDDHLAPRSAQTTTALDGSSCASRNLSRHRVICGPT